MLTDDKLDGYARTPSKICSARSKNIGIDNRQKIQYLLRSKSEYSTIQIWIQYSQHIRLTLIRSRLGISKPGTSRTEIICQSLLSSKTQWLSFVLVWVSQDRQIFPGSLHLKLFLFFSQQDISLCPCSSLRSTSSLTRTRFLKRLHADEKFMFPNSPAVGVVISCQVEKSMTRRGMTQAKAQLQ